jgi:hypothetical protein
MSTVELSAPRSLDASQLPPARAIVATGDAAWWRFLGRWSLFAAINGAVGWAIFLYVSAQGVSAAGERGDLNVAIVYPELWRVAMVYDTLAWLFIGGTVMTFAALLFRQRPILGVLVAAAAMGDLFGSMGGYVRLHAVSDLVAQYLAAASDQQAAVLQTYHQVSLLVSNLQSFGALLTKLALLVIGAATLHMPGFPRWLSVAFVAQAVVGLTNETMSILGISSPLVFLLTVIYVFCFLAWDIAMARLFWRGAPGSRANFPDTSGLMPLATGSPSMDRGQVM